jgi:NAD(P)H-quinone oxidoreductase subunit 6
VMTADIATGEPADQGLIEKSRTPLLLEKSN